MGKTEFSSTAKNRTDSISLVRKKSVARHSRNEYQNETDMLGCHFPSETTNLVVFGGLIGISFFPCILLLKVRIRSLEALNLSFKSSPMRESR